MTKIAIIVDGDHAYPIYRLSDRRYSIDYGGSFGKSEPLPFDSDVQAISCLHSVIDELTR